MRDIRQLVLLACGLVVWAHCATTLRAEAVKCQYTSRFAVRTAPVCLSRTRHKSLQVMQWNMTPVPIRSANAVPGSPSIGTSVQSDPLAGAGIISSQKGLYGLNGKSQTSGLQPTKPEALLVSRGFNEQHVKVNALQAVERLVPCCKHLVNRQRELFQCPSIGTGAG